MLFYANLQKAEPDVLGSAFCRDLVKQSGTELITEIACKVRTVQPANELSCKGVKSEHVYHAFPTQSDIVCISSSTIDLLVSTVSLVQIPVCPLNYLSRHIYSMRSMKASALA